jgi:hypothetical protein
MEVAAMRTIRNLSLSAVAGVMLAAACMPPQPEEDAETAFAELRVNRSMVAAGGEIELTLVNRSQNQIGYNLCTASLERLLAEEWQQVPESPAEVCTMELRILQPGGSDSFQHTMPAALQAGVYRFRTGVEYPLGDSFTAVTSGRFEVTR